MRRILAFGLPAIVGIAVIVWWATRPEHVDLRLTKSEKSAQAERVRSLWNPAARTGPALVPAPSEAVIEPILVLPETETATPAEPAIVTVSPVRVVDRSPTVRPEMGREPRRWMAYAPEDLELTERRKAEWQRLVTAEQGGQPALGGLEETAEPPIAIAPASGGR